MNPLLGLGLEQQVEHAIHLASRQGLDPVRVMQKGIVAGLRVLAEQYDMQRVTPAPSLPTDPGAVIFITGYGGLRANPIRQAMLQEDGTWLTTGIHAGAPALWSARADLITDFIPARVVRDDEHGPAAAFRAIADEARFDSKEPLENVVADLRERAAEAINVMDGEVSK